MSTLLLVVSCTNGSDTQKLAKTDAKKRTGDSKTDASPTDSSTQPTMRKAKQLSQGGKTAPKNEGAGLCATKDEVEASGDMGTSFMIAGSLSVVKVAPNDFLNLRKEASASSPVVTRLNHRQSGLQPTGTVCNVDGVSWYELRAGVHRGFASGRFLRPATRSKNAQKELRSLLSPQPMSSPVELVNKLKEAHDSLGAQQTEGKNVATVLGPVTTGDDASAVLFTCCDLDDAEAGKQYSLEMRKDKRGWHLIGGTARSICYRGVSKDGKMCL